VTERIRITLTSQNVKSLEKGFSIFIETLGSKNCILSLRAIDSWSQGGTFGREGTCSNADQSSAHHNSQNSLWRRIQNMGPLSGLAYYIRQNTFIVGTANLMVQVSAIKNVICKSEGSDRDH
jgi:hypothetical protein